MFLRYDSHQQDGKSGFANKSCWQPRYTGTTSRAHPITIAHGSIVKRDTLLLRCCEPSRWAFSDLGTARVMASWCHPIKWGPITYRNLRLASPFCGRQAPRESLATSSRPYYLYPRRVIGVPISNRSNKALPAQTNACSEASACRGRR